MKQKILYIHGLSSSGSSSTAKNLRMFCPNYEILSPDLPILPDEALDMLRSLCKKEHPNIIIGTSMGGMFAGQLRGYRKILVNPAFHVSEFMRTQIGVHEFRKRLLNYILCIRFFIEVHSIVSASRFFHMPTYLRVVIECQSRFFPFFPAFSRNCPDYFLHTSGSSSFRSLSDLGAR